LSMSVIKILIRDVVKILVITKLGITTKSITYLDVLSKSIVTSNFLTILPIGVELFHTDRRTDGQPDMLKLRVDFRSFTNVPNQLDANCYLR
jgi:hypothetical protein